MKGIKTIAIHLAFIPGLFYILTQREIQDLFGLGSIVFLIYIVGLGLFLGDVA